MGRAVAVLRRHYDPAVEILDADTEMLLLDGQGWGGGASSRLRFREEWVELWSRWREVILPKVIRWRPGTRPLAAYIAGEIPEREILVEPPTSSSSRWFRLYVPTRTGEGRWHYRYPYPFQTPEAWHLRSLGIVEEEEDRRYRERLQAQSQGGTRCRDEYVYEQGLFQ
jgi:hypothetical protein